MDSTLQAELRGDYGVSKAFCGLNRGLFRLATLCGVAFFIIRMAGWSWISARLGIVRTVAAITVRRTRTEWCVGDPG
ncbi:MAG: hypothetical protein DYG94_01060 [Leptolyngbya sp. PLA3]|nr:MAG: hypothetical protein EDM82_00815 [Cyanobacteria bacterium CYA]MCE7967319.1 hypothetical protein [Leptolyngbya sp. PL-A3]